MCPQILSPVAHATVTVQVPTSLVKVGADSTSSQSTCTTGDGLAGCGVTRTFDYQVMDQFSPPQPITKSMVFSDTIATGSPNGCDLGGYNVTPPGTFTFPNGTFHETLGICAPACRSGNACITGCSTSANQTWTVAGVALTGDVKSLSYQCNRILVNGQ
jgi:hypothetical protein